MSVTALAPVPTDVRQRFVELSPRRLRELLYGELQTAADLAELEVVAAATGLDTALLVPATGEIGQDPRTGVLNSCAVPLTCEVEEAEEAADEEDDYDPVTVFEEFRSVVDEPELEAGDDGDEDPLSGTRPAATRRALALRYAQATALTADLVEAVLRGRRGLAVWARQALSMDGLVLTRLPQPAPGLTATAVGVAR